MNATNIKNTNKKTNCFPASRQMGWEGETIGNILPTKQKKRTKLYIFIGLENVAAEIGTFKKNETENISEKSLLQLRKKKKMRNYKNKQVNPYTE